MKQLFKFKNRIFWKNLLSKIHLFSIILFQGITINVGEEQYEDDCLSKCQDTEGCEWYSYHISMKNCFLFTTCPTIDETLVDFTSGQKTCQLGTTTPMPTISTTPSPDQDFSKSTKIIYLLAE